MQWIFLQNRYQQRNINLTIREYEFFGVAFATHFRKLISGNVVTYSNDLENVLTTFQKQA